MSCPGAGGGKRARATDEAEFEAAARTRPRVDEARARPRDTDNVHIMLEPTILLDASISGGGAEVGSVASKGGTIVETPTEAASSTVTSQSRVASGGGAGPSFALPSSLLLPAAWGPVVGPRNAIMIECDKMAAPYEGASASANQIRPALVLLQLAATMLKEIPDAGSSGVLRKRIYDVVRAQKGHGESAFFKELTCSVHLGLIGEDDGAPVSLACGHNFCRRCVVPLFASPSPTCPTCREAISVPLSALKVNSGIKGIVEHLLTEDALHEVKAAAATGCGVMVQPPPPPPPCPLGISLAGFKEIIARAGGREKLLGKTTDWVKTHVVLPTTFNDVSSGGGRWGQNASSAVTRRVTSRNFICTRKLRKNIGPAAACQ